MRNNPIIALDFPNSDETYQFLSIFNYELFVKVGMELYLQEGPSIVSTLKDMGHDVFLDFFVHVDVADYLACPHDVFR